MKSFSIANHFAVAAIQGALRQGHPVEKILEGTGISPSLLNQPKARVPSQKFTLLIQRLWALLDDELMGFGDMTGRPGTFATLCQLAVHTPNLEVLFKRWIRFYDLFEHGPQMGMEIENGVVTLSLESPDFQHDTHHFLKESLLVIWHRTSCWMVDQRINLTEVGFSFPEPEHASEYRSIYYCPIQFSQSKTYLKFSIEALKYPVVQNERTLLQFLHSSPADLLARPTKDDSFTGKIRNFIGRDIDGEMPSFEEVADHLHMTPQTLRRRLKAENTSYQELKDNIRRDISIHLLSRGDIGVNEIALQVGFTEPSTFHRAFKKWTGVTPSVYREQLAKEQSL